MHEQIQNYQKEYYLTLAKTAPRIKGRERERVTFHQQYGNNLFLLFKARKLVEQDPQALEKDWIQGTFANLTRKEKQWERFLQTNSSLIHKIDMALDGLKPYDELIDYYNYLLNQKNFAEAESFRTSIDLDLGLESVGIFVWNRLNPLLKRAAKKMKKLGLPTFL